MKPHSVIVYSVFCIQTCTCKGKLRCDIGGSLRSDIHTPKSKLQSIGKGGGVATSKLLGATLAQLGDPARVL